MYRYFALALILLTLSPPSYGQISYGGSPLSFGTKFKSSVLIPVIEMAPVVNKELLLEDALSSQSKSHIFAHTFNTNISIADYGLAEQYGGYNIWRIRIKSAGAFSLNLIFSDFVVPTGASLYIYNPDKTVVRGAYNANNEQTSGVLPTLPIPGDEVIVEYNEPIDIGFRGQIHIVAVNHDFKNAFGDRPLGEAESCNIDLACSEAKDYQTEKKAVVQLIVNGRELCTGTLVNNVREDHSPFLITAGHCVENADDAQKSVYIYNYESPFCGRNSSVNGFADQSMTGAILRSRSDLLDFALVELENIPPPEFMPFYAGWDVSEAQSGPTATIHHPKGDVKKFSFDNDPPVIGSYNDNSYLKNGFWWIKRWDLGTTESGSSGSPLISSKKLLIGTLTGGTANCTNSVDDYFSMFSKQWNYLPQSDSQLKYWLNPDNASVVSLRSIDPYTTTEQCSSFSNQSSSENYLSEKTKDNRGMIAGNNQLGIKEFAEKFSQTKTTTLNGVVLGISKAVASASSTRSVTIQIRTTDQVSGLPGESLYKVILPIGFFESEKSNYIPFANDVTVQDDYFVTVGFDFGQSRDSLVLYHATDRVDMAKNRSYALIGEEWKPLYWIPQISISTSLLIAANGCNSTLAEIKPEPVPGEKRFALHYPLGTGQANIKLINNGDEEYGAISIYDTLGKMHFFEERMLTRAPINLNLSDLSHQGVYFLKIKIRNEVQTLKMVVQSAY